MENKNEEELTVLIIEDEQNVFESIWKSYEALGYKITRDMNWWFYGAK